MRIMSAATDDRAAVTRSKREVKKETQCLNTFLFYQFEHRVSL